MRTLASLWSLLDRQQKLAFAGLQVLSLLMAFSTVGGIAAVLPFFTVLADPDALNHHPRLLALYTSLHFASERRFVVALGVSFAGVVVLASGINLIGMRAINRFAARVGERFHTELFDDYLHRSYAFHLRTHSAQLVTNVLHSTTRATTGVVRSGLILISNGITIVVIAASLAWVNPLVALATLTGFGLCYGVVYTAVHGRLVRNGRSETRDYAARAQVINESFLAIKELLVLRAQRAFADRFALYCRSISNTIVDTLTISQSPKYLIEAAAVAALVGVALYLSGAGTSWVAQLSFIGLAAYRLLPAMQEAFAASVRIRAEIPAFESVAGDLRSARERLGRRQSPAPQQGRRPHELLLRGVSYAYEPGRSAAVADVTLRVPAGARVGLIGPNGCGKSTLVDLVVGLLEPQAGVVEVDGVPLADRAQWQASLAYIPQSIALLDASIAENIALGVPAEQIDLSKVLAAARLARLDEYVESLPRGYEEMIGERGVRLSGGQRQRLGIARALYRDASVLIMDEGTNALDMATERDIVDMLVTEWRGRTLLLVAHHLSTLRHCDVIYQMAKGRIVRCGTPAEFPQQPESAVNAS